MLGLSIFSLFLLLILLLSVFRLNRATGTDHTRSLGSAQLDLGIGDTLVCIAP